MKNVARLLISTVMLLGLCLGAAQGVRAEENTEPVEFAGATEVGNAKWTDPDTSKTYNVYLNDSGSFKAATDKVPARGPAYITFDRAYKTRMDNTLGDGGSVYSPGTSVYYYFTLENPTKVTVYAQSSDASNSSLSIEKIDNIASFKPSTAPLGMVVSTDAVKSISADLVAGDYLVTLNWGQGRPENVGECVSYVKVNAECLINQESSDEWYETFPNYSFEAWEGPTKKIKYVCTPYMLGKTMNGVTGIGNVDSTNKYTIGYFSFTISGKKKLHFDSINNISSAYVFTRSESFPLPTNEVAGLGDGMILEPNEYVLAVYSYAKGPYSFSTSIEDVICVHNYTDYHSEGNGKHTVICHLCQAEDLARTNVDCTNTEIRNKKAATTSAEGYTGDTYCKDCGGLVTKGESIPKLEAPKKPEEPRTPEVTYVAATSATSTEGAAVATNADGTAVVSKVNPKAKSVTLDTVNVNGVSYTVTKVKKDAFKNAKATKVTLGSGVTSIDSKAFNGAKVKTITLKATGKIKVAKTAFKGSKIDTKKMTIRVPKAMSKANFSALQKALKKAGYKGKVKRA